MSDKHDVKAQEILESCWEILGSCCFLEDRIAQALRDAEKFGYEYGRADSRREIGEHLDNEICDRGWTEVSFIRAWALEVDPDAHNEPTPKSQIEEVGDC